MLNKFTGGNASKTLNADGTFTMGITSGTTARLHQKNINLAMNDTNGFEVRAKLENVSRVDLFLYGQYTLNGTAGAGDNYQHLYRGLSTQGWTTSLPDADGYVTMVYDLAYIANNESAKDFVYNVINGFCIDIYGSENGKIKVDYVKSIKIEKSYTVNYYVDGAVKKTATVKEGEKAIALKDEEGALGRQIVGYYTDAAFTQVFDMANTAITQDTNLYVKLSDYVYFNGAMISKFAGGNASKTLNADGTFTMGITSGTTARLHQKNINLAMNDTNGFEVRAKLENVSRVDLFLYGQYTLNGTAGAGDNYQHLYRGLSTQGWTTSLPDADGYVTMVYDLAYIANNESAKDFVYNVINGFCIDIYGSENGKIKIDYVKSIKK